MLLLLRIVHVRPQSCTSQEEHQCPLHCLRVLLLCVLSKLSVNNRMTDRLQHLKSLFDCYVDLFTVGPFAVNIYSYTPRCFFNVNAHSFATHAIDIFFKIPSNFFAFSFQIFHFEENNMARKI